MDYDNGIDFGDDPWATGWLERCGEAESCTSCTHYYKDDGTLRLLEYQCAQKVDLFDLCATSTCRKFEKYNYIITR